MPLLRTIAKAWRWYWPASEASPRELNASLNVIPLETRRVLNADGFTSELVSLGESEPALSTQGMLNETHTEHHETNTNTQVTNTQQQQVGVLAASSEVVFLDASIEGYHLLETSLSEAFEIVVLESDEDATQHITRSLKSKHSLDAIHILSHGAPGKISLGSHQLTSENLGQYAELLTSLQNALSDSGDIFIYGCEVAQGEIGEGFTSALASVTDADVAASIDKTGSISLGGNWDLEYSHGEIGETLLTENLHATNFNQLLDTESPTATVELAADFLSSTSNSTTLTITFSEDIAFSDVPGGFNDGDLILSNGSITAGSYDSSSFTYTALFTADSNVDSTGGVELVTGSYEDAAGNPGGGSSDTADIDTRNPTSTITFNGSLLSSVSNTTTVTIEFSEDPVGFDETDLVVSNGILSGFSGQDTVWTATFEAASNFAGDGGVQLLGGSYTDHVDFQNPGVGSSGSISIDTLNPVVTSVVREDSNYTNATEVSYVVTFSEDVTGVDVDGSDFRLVNSIADASISSVAGSNATYHVTVNTGTSAGSIELALAATPTIQDAVGNDLIDSAIAGTNEAYTIASTEVLLTGGNVSVADIRDATVDDINLSLTGSDLIISSASDSIAAGAGVTRIDASSVSVALADINGSNGVTVLAGDLDDRVTVEGIGRRLEIVGGDGADVVQLQNVALSTNGGDLLIDAEGLTQDADASINANNVTLGSLGSSFVLNAAITTTGDLLVNTSGDLLQTQSGLLVVGGVTTLNANVLILENSANDFQGAVHASGSSLSFVDANEINFGDIDAAGAFSASALSGSIDDGAETLNGADINVAGDAMFTASRMITLDDQWNGFGGQVTVDAQDVFLAAQNDVLLFDVDVDELTVTTTGSISDGLDGDIVVTGNASFTGSAITIGNDAGDTVKFGTLTFNSAGSVLISEDSSLDLVGTNTAGSADLDSTANVSDAGATSVSVTGLLDVAGASIALGSGTLNAGSLTFNSEGSVAISANSSLDLVGTNTAGSADLDSTADVSDAGATSVDVTGFLDVSGTSVVLGSGTFNAGTLTFNSSGSVSLTEDSSMLISGASSAGSGLDLVSTSAVTLDASVTVVGDTNITAGTTVGSIDVNAKLNGSGMILLDAAEEITIDASIDPTIVTLNADDDITVNAAVVASDLITVSAGEDGSGSFVLGSSGSLETTNAGSDVIVTTGTGGGEITLSGTTTALDKVTMTAASGSINGSGLVSSSTVDLNAFSGIGDTTFVSLSSGTVTADTVSGDIDLSNNHSTAVDVSSLTTGTGSVSFSQAGGGDISFSGPVVSGGIVDGGAISLTADSGLSVDGSVSSALGTGGTLLASGATLSGSVTVGAGDVVIQGGAADLIVDSGVTAGGDLTLTALRDVIVNAVVNADNGGSIVVVADANNAIDAGSGSGGHGGVRITSAGQLDAEGEVTAVGSDLFASSSQVDSILIDADGATVQVLAVGNIALTHGSNAPLNASTIINGVVQTSGAAATITVSGEQDVQFGALADIISVDGDVTIVADSGAGLNGGEVFMANGASVSSDSGQISISADGDITLGSLNTGNTSDTAVELITTSGAIVDGGDLGIDVLANSGGLFIRSDTGVGSGNAIETSVGEVDAQNSADGDMRVSESDDIFVESLSQDGAGAILFESVSGTVEILVSGAGVSGGENVRLASLSQDVIVNANVVSVTGSITLDAGNDLAVNAAVTTGGSGTLYMVAANDLTVAGALTTASGDILLEAGSDLLQDAGITSTSGDIGLIAGVTLSQTSSGDIATGGDVLLEAGGGWTMAGDAVITAVGNVSGQALGGDIDLGVINGADVGLTASGSIFDANSGALNISATNLSLRADGGLIGGDDASNGTPGQNANAIDIAVSTLAANAESGIYVSEADGLTVTTAVAVTVNVGSALRVNFNSTTSSEARTRTTSSLEDLSTDTAGPIKLVSVAGSLTIDGGADGQGVSASGDVLLSAASDVTINADVESVTGNITLEAGNDLTVNAAVTTGGSGTLYMVAANDLTVTGALTTASGDILLEAGSDLLQDAGITSTSGDIGLIAGVMLSQTSSGDIATGGDVLLEAGGGWTMAGDAVITAVGNVSGQALGGDIDLGVINGADVGLTASGSIVDANSGALNISATNLSLRADGGLIGVDDASNGTPGQNAKAIDIAVSTLAANAESGIYLSEADGLTVTTAVAVTVNVGSALRVNFNSTTSSEARTRTTSSLEDLSTDTAGPIKLVSVAGSLTIDGGADGQGVSASGDVLLSAASDVTINADVESVTGNITLEAGNDLTVNAAVTTGGSGTLYMVAANDLTVTGALTTASGDILLEAGSDLLQDAGITSTSGDIGLIAGVTLSQTSSGDIATGGDVLLEAGGGWAMAGDAVITAVGNVSGQALGGDIDLGVINGADVGLTASGSIVDANSGALNISATNLSLRADGGLIGVDDASNGTPGQNANAIDIAVSTLAANAESGIYVSEADGLTVTTAVAVTVNVGSALRVNFNSTTSSEARTRTTSSLEDLSTDTAGPIKLVSVAGSLTIDGGADGQGVSASGDVLLSAASDVTINADVESVTGNITLEAGNDLAVNSAVTTGGSGTLYMVAANDLTVTGVLTTASGDILLEAGSDLLQDAGITNTSGDIGLIAGVTLSQTSSGDITTGGDVLLEAGSGWTMAGDAVITAVGNVSGQALGGDIDLGVINGADVGLTASGSIVDANSGALNISATNLSLRADGGLIGGDDASNGTPGQNANAIDIAVSTLAANAESGIYLSEADGLTVNAISDVTVDIESVFRVDFNSTTSDASEDRTTSSLEDLSTDTSGPIKLVSVAGSLTIEGGADGQGVSASGDVLLSAASDVTVNADVVSGSGTLTQNCYLYPDLKAELDPVDQQLTNENPNAKFNVYVAPGSAVGVGIGWKGLATEQAYVVNGVGGGATTTAVELPFNTALKLIENTAVIAVSLNAFAPSSEGVGTIQIFENGENVLAQERFHTMVSVNVSANMTGQMAMMPRVTEMGERIGPSPVVLYLPPPAQPNDMIVAREYYQSTMSGSESSEPFFFLKFEGLIPQESDGDLSLDYKLKSLSATEANSDADFDVDQLPILFGRLPDNYYELYLKDGASEQLIMRFIIQDGNPINVPTEFSRIELSNEFHNQELRKKDNTGVDQEVVVSEKPHRKRNNEVNENVELASPDTTEFPPETEPTDEPATTDGRTGPEELRPLSLIEELGRTPVIALAGTLLTGTRYRYEQKQKITECSEVTK